MALLTQNRAFKEPYLNKRHIGMLANLFLNVISQIQDKLEAEREMCMRRTLCKD